MEFYSYDGPVFEFDRCIDRNWHATTYAVSKKKAISNFIYQYKMSHNRTRTANITLKEESVTAIRKEQ